MHRLRPDHEHEWLRKVCDLVDLVCVDMQVLLPQVMQGLARSFKAHIDMMYNTKDRNEHEPNHLNENENEIKQPNEQVHEQKPKIKQGLL
mmetsp:Transcript_25747/g.56783  ORF Transcript_25747/g.56783 Transcript_25747/m.56783 type:complete len:90 (+) Transcript_25747:119-388(+)